jgi:hypothetical protein
MDGRGDAVGGIGTLALVGPLAIGAGWAIRRQLPGASGAVRLLGGATLGWAWLTLGTVGLGSVGLLTRPALAAWSALGLLVALMAWRPARAPAATPDRGPDAPLGLVARLAIGLTAAMAVPYLVESLLGPVKVVSDAPIYHLYFAARWWKAERLLLVPVPFGENAATYFPAGGDVVFTWLFAAWGGDTLAKVGQFPFLVLAAVAVGAIAREVGARREAAVLAACLFATSTPLALFSFEGNVDTIFVAGYLVATLFFLRAAVGAEPTASRALGAIAAGLAWGTKPTATVFVPPLLALVALGIVGRRRPGWARDLAIVAGLPLVPCGFWFARNALLTGNPLYPLDLPILGWVGWYGPEVMRRSQYYLPREDLRALADIVLSVFDPRLMPLWLAGLAGAWRPGARRGDRDGWVWPLAALAVLNVALYWLFIPYRTQQRFFLQAVGLAAVPLARLLDRAGWLRWLALVLLAAHLLTPQGWPLTAPGREPPWDFSPLVPNGMAPLLAVFGPNAAALGILLVASLGLAGVLFGPLARRDRWRVGGGLAAFVVLAAGWAAFGLSPRTRAEPFYPPFRDYLAGWRRLESLSPPAGARVAYAGTNIPYYLMARGLRNDVLYVNVDAHPTWLLHDYHRQARAGGRPYWEGYPRPGWDRQAPDRDAWLANLRAAGVDFLVVTRVNPQEGPHNVADASGFPIEHQWAEALAADFLPVYGSGTDPLFRIYRVLPRKT